MFVCITIHITLFISVLFCSPSRVYSRPIACPDGQVLFNTMEGSWCCKTLSSSCGPGYEIKPCLPEEPNTTRCERCPDSYYQDKENGSCKPQPHCFGPMKGKDIPLHLNTMDDYSKHCTDNDSCSCKLSKAGTIYDKWEWTCAANYHKREDDRGNVYCLPKDKVDTSEAPSRESPNLPHLPEIKPSKNPKKEPNEMNEKREKEPTLPIPSVESKEKYDDKRIPWIVSTSVLSVLLFLTLLIGAIYIIRKKHHAKKKRINDDQALDEINRSINIIDKKNREKLRVPFQDSYRDFCFQAISKLLSKESIASKYKELARTLELENIQGIENQNVSDAEKIQAVLDTYVVYNPPRGEHLLLVNFLHVNKELETLYIIHSQIQIYFGKFFNDQKATQEENCDGTRGDGDDDDTEINGAEENDRLLNRNGGSRDTGFSATPNETPMNSLRRPLKKVYQVDPAPENIGVGITESAV